mgnify:FL=1|tara:strand:+ start:43 stop:816 length:774 start_codon:yes stop_codon:yes gene_type:complete
MPATFRLHDDIARRVALPSRAVDILKEDPEFLERGFHPSGIRRKIFGDFNPNTGQSRVFGRNIADELRKAAQSTWRSLEPQQRGQLGQEVTKGVRRHEIGHRWIENLRGAAGEGDVKAQTFLFDIDKQAAEAVKDVNLKRAKEGLSSVKPDEIIADSLEGGLSRKRIKSLKGPAKSIANKFFTLVKENKELFNKVIGLTGVSFLTKALGPIGNIVDIGSTAANLVQGQGSSGTPIGSQQFQNPLSRRLLQQRSGGAL